MIWLKKQQSYRLFNDFLAFKNVQATTQLTNNLMTELHCHCKCS